MSVDVSQDINRYQNLIANNDIEIQDITKKLAKLDHVRQDLLNLKKQYQKFREDTKQAFKQCKELIPNVRTAVTFSNGMMDYVEGDEANNGEDGINIAISKVNLAITNANNKISSLRQANQSYQASIQNLQTQKKGEDN